MVETKCWSLLSLSHVVRQHDCPPDYVVVANNNHQLPLGSVTFEGVENQVMSHSSRMRRQLAYLSKIADRKAQEANDAMHKAEIIQLLIGKQVDIASEKYQNYLVDLTYISKREIAMYVHRLVDKDSFIFLLPRASRANEDGGTRCCSYP